MATTTKQNTQFCTTAPSIDANIGPWSSISAYMTWLSDTIGMDAPLEGTEILVKDASTGKQTKYRYEIVSGTATWTTASSDVTVDSSLDITSTNPVQNAAVASAIASLQSAVQSATSSAEDSASSASSASSSAESASASSAAAASSASRSTSLASQAAASATSANNSAVAAAQSLAIIQQAIDGLDPSTSTEDAIVALTAQVASKASSSDLNSVSQDLSGLEDEVASVRDEVIPELFLSDLVVSSDATTQVRLNACVPYLYMLTSPAEGHRYSVTYFYKYGDKIEIHIYDYDETEGTQTQIVNGRYTMDSKVALSMNGGSALGYIYISSADYIGDVYSSGETTDRFPYLGAPCFNNTEGMAYSKVLMGKMSDRITANETNIASVEASISGIETKADAAIGGFEADATTPDYSYDGTLNSDGANYDGLNTDYEVRYFPVSEGKKYNVEATCTTNAEMYTKIAALCYLNTTSNTRTPIVLQDQGTTVSYTRELTIPSGVNYLMICQKVAAGSEDTCSVNQIITTPELQAQIDEILQNSSMGDLVLYYIPENISGSQGGTLNWLGDSYGNGATGFENCMVYYYQVVAGKSYRIRATITAPSVDYPDHIAAVCFYTEGSNPTKTPLKILYAGNTESYDFIYTPEVNGYIYICQDTSVDAANSYSIFRKIDTSVQAIMENNATPYKGKKWFACGDSYTMLGAYFAHVIGATGMTLLGSTGASGNGQPITYMCHLLHSTFATQVAQADVVTIFAGTNDVGSMSNETPGDFETSAAASMTVIDSSEGEVKAAITTIYGAVKSAVAAIRDINKDCLIVFITQPERSAFTINTNDYSINPSWGYCPNKTAGGLNMQVVADCITDCCKRLGVPCYDFHANGWDYAQNCDDSAAVMAAIKVKIANNETPSSFLNTNYDGRTYAVAYAEDALTQRFTYDGLHPNDAGAERMGRQIGKFINTL